MRKIVLTFGLIAGAILSVMMLVTQSFFDQIGFDKGEIIGYTTMVLAFLMVFFGVRSYRDNVAGAIADKHRTWLSGQHHASIDPDRATMIAGSKFYDVTGLGTIQHSLKRPLWTGLQRLRCGEARDSGGEDRRRNDAWEAAHVSFPLQAVFGSTNMRPFISMCMA